MPSDTFKTRCPRPRRVPYCSNCGRELEDGVRYCSNCGHSATARPRSQFLPAPGEAPSEAVAIVALLLNVFLLPGLGTLIAGRNEGWYQIGLVIAGVLLAIILIGFPLLFAAWVWGLVSGIQALRDAQNAARGA